MENNKKYKILGINVIDLLVILAIICVAVLAVVTILGIGKPEQQMYSITYRLDEVSSFVTDHLQDNCRLYDDNQDNDLGRCTFFELDKSISLGTNASGEHVRSESEGLNSLTLIGEVAAQEGKNGVIVGGYEYCVGDMIVLRAGDAKLYIGITDISPVE